MSTECPSCGQSLGLLWAEDARAGALYVHRKGFCDAVLVLVAAESPPELEMRLATEEEKKAWAP
jgi:hypothetical protein